MWKRYEKIIITFLLIILTCRYITRLSYNINIQYVLLSTGEKYKYVSIIKSLLNEQGVLNSDIHVFLDRELVLDIADINQHIIPSTMNGMTKNVILNNNYKYIFKTIFEQYPFAVILEDDIFPSSDAVSYFKWGREIMDYDPSIFSVSGSNDNSIDRLHGKIPDVFSRAEQFLGLGWMTSDVVYRKHIRQYIDQCPSKLAWDQCTSSALSDNKMVTIFPMVQRTLHVPYVKGTHKNLVGLSFNTIQNVKYPQPHLLSDKYYKEYITNNVLPLSTVIRMDNTYDITTWKQIIKKNTDIPWPISHLAGKPFGYNNDIVVFPGANKPIVFIYNGSTQSKSSFRIWKT